MADGTVTLRWITPNAEQVVIDEARVSSSKGDGEPGEGLLRYLIEHKHWSPFEMANMCVRILTTREISRQILRHRSFHFQEYSQRYAEQIASVANVGEARLQDDKNRQHSIDLDLNDWRHVAWRERQADLIAHANEAYQWARSVGLAKEVSRKVLPEGLTTSDLRMNGTIRDWIHFINLRSSNGTQKETARIAIACGELLREHCPTIYGAAIV